MRYAASHEWAAKDGTVGISGFAVEALGDLVYVELPEVGETFEKGDVFGSVESVKSSSGVYAPIGGSVVAVNEKLADNPELVNQEPLGEGWLIKLKPSIPNEDQTLMDYTSYEHTNGSD